jgi:hypothetical protein
MAVDHASLDSLVASAPNQRDLQRLRRCNTDRASQWITAIPSHPDTIIPPAHFRIAVARLLGLPVLPTAVPCPNCKSSICRFGDHASACKGAGGLISRHNRLRDAIAGLAREALLSPVLEKAGILGDLSKRRPGDVSFPVWENGLPLAIDCAIICPLAPAHLHELNPADAYGEHHKHKVVDHRFIGTGWQFAAVVAETLGAFAKEAQTVLGKIIRAAAKRSTTPTSRFIGIAWARLSCIVVRGTAQMILDRLPQVDCEMPPPSH